MPFASPFCKHCLGSGDIERIEMRDDVITAFIYEPCPCTFRTQWVDEEDWTNERSNLTT
jgi:hypothetical protein